MHYILNPAINMRLEYFGALARDSRAGSIYKFAPHIAFILFFFQRPRPLPTYFEQHKSLNEVFPAQVGEWIKSCHELIKQEILIQASSNIRGLIDKDKGGATLDTEIKAFKSSLPQVNIVKPFWVHLQPFTKCNQRCIHCYCEGSAQAQGFILSLKQWRDIIDKLAQYGIFDIYITGGENLIYQGFFDLASHIVAKGLGFGLSTNATAVSEKTLEKLKILKLKRAQVSFDGGTAETYNFIRGVKDGYQKALKGLEKLSTIVEPVINTVVNKRNFNELELIIQIGKKYNSNKFKFFPQKNCGRSLQYPNIIFNDEEIKSFIIPTCQKLAIKHEVEIETIGSENCGSGTSGFAVDQYGFAYPCIFGVEDHSQRVGNVLEDNLDNIWFHSEKLHLFRSRHGGKICHRCEVPLC